MGDTFGGGKEKKVVGYQQAPPNYEKFLDNYFTSFGKPGGGGGLNNQSFQESLSGYYGGQPYEEIATNLAKTNTFKPRAKPIYKYVPDGGLLGDLGMGGGGGPIDFSSPPNLFDGKMFPSLF